MLILHLKTVFMYTFYLKKSYNQLSLKYLLVSITMQNMSREFQSLLKLILRKYFFTRKPHNDHYAFKTQKPTKTTCSLGVCFDLLFALHHYLST